MSDRNSTPDVPVVQAPDRCQCGQEATAFILGIGRCCDCHHSELDERGHPRIVRFGDSNYEVCRKVPDVGWDRLHLWGRDVEAIRAIGREIERALNRPVLDLREKGGGP